MMTLSRQELSELLSVGQKYLYPANFELVKISARNKGYNLLAMHGKGHAATYDLEPLEPLILPNEEWVPCYLDPNYSVSSLGRVKDPKGNLLKGTDSRGYVRVRIHNHGQPYVHRLILQSFNPVNNPELLSVDHINGQRNDNKLINLRWVFQKENAEFSDENNTKIREIIATLVQKYGYFETIELLKTLLPKEKSE